MTHTDFISVFCYIYKMILVVAMMFFALFLFYNNCWHILTIFVMIIFYNVVQRQLKQTLPIDRKSVLITGCDTGFGHYLAKRLIDHGFTVFAGVLHEFGDGAYKLRTEQSKRLHVVKLDVTKDADVAKTLAYVNTVCLKNEFWGVVNNAGFYIPGDVEMCTISQFKRNADVNIYGYIRIIKAFLPLIRKSKGRIVNISSVRGLYSCPGMSAYNMTKFAVEALSDALRLEMQNFGVKVSIVEPGVYDGCTAMSGSEQTKRVKSELEEMWNVASDEVRETYGINYVDKIIEGLENDKVAKTWISPNPVLQAIEDGLLNREPKPRYLVSGAGWPVDYYAMVGRIYKYLPEYISDIILRRLDRL